MPGAGAKGPFSAARRGDLSPLQFATQGGRIFGAFTAASGSNVRFKGRYLQRFTTRPPVEIVPAWFCWRASIGADIAMPNAVPMTAVAAVIYDTNGVTPLGSVAVVTKNGSTAFTIPTGIDTFLADTLTPASFGLAAFPAQGYVEWRVLYDLAAGQSAPSIGGSGRPGQQQSFIGTVAQLPNDVVGTGLMASSSTTYTGIFFPCALGRFRGAVRSALMIGDSLTERTWDFVPMVGLNPAGGGGLFSRACLAAEVPFFNAGVAGRSARNMVDATRTLALAQYARLATTCLGTNDISGTLPGGTAGQPMTISYMTDQNKAVWATLRGYGVGRIVATTIPPRVADNNYKCTSLSQQTPFLTGATVAGGAPANGYGFGANETAEQWNAVLLALSGASDGPNAVFDFNAYCRDPVTTWKWKLHPYATTLAAAVAASGAFSLSVNAAPPQFAMPVLEPGVANVDGTTMLYAMSVSGSGPYTITFEFADTYVNAMWQPAPNKAHALGATVKGTYCFDGTHPTTEQHRALAVPLAAML